MLLKRFCLLLMLVALWACPGNKNTNQPTTQVTTPTNPDDESDSGPSKSGPPTAAELAQHPEWFQCSADSDCEYKEMECCDYCNGGFALVVNKKFSADARKAWGKDACQETMCTQMACTQNIVASCQKNVCTPMVDNKPRSNPITR